GLQAEYRLELGLVMTFGNQAGIGAVAEQQAKGVYQNRLAGTGFAGDDGKAGFDVDLDFANNGKLANRKVTKHALSGRARRPNKLAPRTRLGNGGCVDSSRPPLL